MDYEFHLRRIDNGWVVEGKTPGKSPLEDNLDVYCRTIESAVEFIKIWVKEGKEKAIRWLSPSVTNEKL
ncbi:MAG: hypothetical protein HWN68_06485 [Desulfobacterales bacterium]|nr:hypothetical protein [Desulfobacterales bacterium]